MISSKAASARAVASGSDASKVTRGWKLPSPAWPITGMAVAWRSAMATTAATSSGMRGMGTPMSSMSTVPSRSTQGIAMRRAPMSSSPSSGSSVTAT